MKVDEALKYRLLYEYEQMENKGMVSVRVPQKLKEDFILACGGQRGYSKVLREFMLQHILENYDRVQAERPKTKE